MAETDRHKLHHSSEACIHVVECTHTIGGRNSERRVNWQANISNTVHIGENSVKHTQAGTQAFQKVINKSSPTHQKNAYMLIRAHMQ